MYVQQAMHDQRRARFEHLSTRPSEIPRRRPLRRLSKEDRHHLCHPRADPPLPAGHPAHVPGAVTCPLELPGLCHWLLISAPGGFVAVWDAQELGEHGLAVQAFELDNGEQLTNAGHIAWVWNKPPRASSRRGSATTSPIANVSGSPIEHRKPLPLPLPEHPAAAVSDYTTTPTDTQALPRANPRRADAKATSRRTPRRGRRRPRRRSGRPSPTTSPDALCCDGTQGVGNGPQKEAAGGGGSVGKAGRGRG